MQNTRAIFFAFILIPLLFGRRVTIFLPVEDSRVKQKR